MPIYKVGDKKYNVPQEELEGFLAEFPEAEEFTEGKTSITETDTTVNVTEVSAGMDLALDFGSSELPKTKSSKEQSTIIESTIDEDEKDLIKRNFNSIQYDIDESLSDRAIKKDEAKIGRFKRGNFKTAEKEEYQQFKETGKISSYVYKEEEIDQLVSNAQRDFMEDLSTEDRQAMLSDEMGYIKPIQERRDKTLNKIYDNKLAVETIIKDYNIAQESGAPYSEEERLAAVKKVEEISNSMQLMYDAVNKDNSLLDDEKEFIDSFKRSYSNVDQLTNITKAVATDMALGVAVTLDILTAKEGEKSSLRNNLAEYREELQVISDTKLPKPIPVSSISNVSDFLNWGTDGLVNFVPSGIMAFSGPAAMPLFFASGYGGRMSEFELEERKAEKSIPLLEKQLSETTDPTEIAKIQEEINRQNEVLTTTDLSKLLVSTIYGTSEVVTEKLTTLRLVDDLKSANTVFQTDGFGKALVQKIKEIPTGPALEGGGEGVNALVGNFADIYIVGADKSLFDGVDEAAAQGALIGTGFKVSETGMLGKAAALDVISDRSEKKKLEDIRNDITLLTSQLDKESDPNKRFEILGTIRNKVKETVLEQDFTATQFLKLSEKEQQEVFESDRKARKVNKRWARVAGSNIDEKAKEVIRKDLEAEYNSYQDNKTVVLRKSSSDLKELAKVEGLKSGDFNRNYKIYTVNDGAVKRNNKLRNFANKIIGVTESEIEKIQDFISSEETSITLLDKSVLNKEDATEVLETWNNRATGGFSPSTKNIYSFVERSASGNPSTVLHEYFHAMALSKGFTKEQYEALRGDYISMLSAKVEDGSITESQREDILARYLQEYGGSVENAEELINLTADAVNLDILKQDDVTFLQKFATNVKSIIGTILSKEEADNYSIDTAEDAWNMVQTFSQDVLSKRKGPTVVSSGEPVESQDSEIKESRIVSPQATALKDALSNEELVESINSPTTEDKFSVAQAIVEKNWPVISKQIDFTPAQQDTAKEVVEEQILGVFQGSGQGKYSARNTGLFNAFDPSVAQVNTYLGKTIGSRKPEIDLAIKERANVTGEDLSKAEGITVTESTPAQVDTKKIKPSSLLPSDVVSKVNKEVKEKLKDVPVDKLTFKKLGNLAPEIIAEAIGIPVKKLTDAAANLSKSDASAIQRFISQKPETLIKLLPEGAVLEAATQKLMGTSTGVPKSLLDAFYTKQDRTTDPSGLYPFKLNSNLNRANFLEAFGIVDGKKAKEFSPRSTEAQRLKGIASLFGRLVTNEIARSEGDLSLETAKDVAAGKSKLMFSKSLKDKPDLLKYFNEELKGLSPGQIVQEIEFLENRAEILGMEQDEAFEQMFTNDNSYKKLRKTLKLKDGGKRNISSKENSKQLKKTHSLFIKGMIPKGKEFKDLPKQTQQFLLDTVGFGDTRITIGDVPLTYKAVTEGVKGYEGLLAKMYGKDILKGTGSDFNFIDVFAPRNWGEKGFRGKVQKIVESNKDNKLKARKEVEKLLTSKDGNVTKTIKANRDALTRAYDVLADIVIKNPSKETISAVADLLESQVNRATGVFKGLVPVTSFNMKPEKGNTKNENKMMHNEHLVELFNANKFFIESLSKFVEGKINESELLNMSRVNAASLEQAVISERMRVEKDASGAAVRDFLNPLTFLGKDAVNQVPIGVESLAVSEQIAQDLEKKQKELVKKASDKKLNSVGVIVKQLLDNNRVYLYTKSKNSDKLSKLIKLSKSETNQEILNIMKSVDDASQKVELKFSKSLDLNKDFNDIIENKTGIASDKTYARVKAEVAGASKGKFNFFIPPSAEDFVGLLYSTLGKGSTGDAQMAWYKAHLLNPFARAMENIANDRVAMIQDYKGLKKALKIVPKDLRKKVPGEPFTREQAVRVYIWDQQGMEIPGLSKKDQSDLVKYVNDSTELTAFADQLIAINKGDEYASPDAGWVAGTIDTDFLKALNTTKRAKYLEVWQQNVDEIFSETNLNKLEAAYGKPYRVAMENILHRMKTGRNRSFGTDTITGRFTDWLTNSVGAIMFFNTRSAVLQTISAVNFINFSDNNVLRARSSLR